MDLTLNEVAELLNVSETTIRRWVAEGKIPAHKFKGKTHFTRLEIESWVMNHKLGSTNGKSPFTKQDKKSAATTKGGNQKFSLYRALHNGEVLKNIPGNTKEEVIRNSTKILSKKLNLDHELLSELLLDREKLHPTALNNGIAAPHSRDFTLSKQNDVVAILFPQKPIPYGALDGEPVHTLIFVFAGNDKRHLHLLAKIAHLSSHDSTTKLFSTQPSKDKLLAHVQHWESEIPNPDED